MDPQNAVSHSYLQDFEAIEQIGRGAFGASYLMLHKFQNTRYVLKKIHLSKQTDKFKRTAYQEMNMLAKLHNPYILEYKGAWVEKGSCICILTDYCQNGNIYQIMKKAKRAYFSEEKICKWLTQLLLAIDYLHSNRVLHRDLKLSNIFITKENDVRLGDFGLAKLFNEEGLVSSVAGTPNYMCPELLADVPYGYKSDIWSLGCCIFEIAAHQQAFRAPDMAGLINKINRSLISPLPIAYSSTLKQIIKSMLRKSPEHRPTAADLLRHPHLQPFLLRCQNPPPTLLPVKSPSPNTKEKTRKPTPGSFGNEKDNNNNRENETKLKQKDLLPLFEENTDNIHYLNLLDDNALMEYELVTKRVDPTSYSGKISHDSEDSKSEKTSETTVCNGDDPENSDSSSFKESVKTFDALNLALIAVPPQAASINAEPICSHEVTKITETKAEDSTDDREPIVNTAAGVCSDLPSEDNQIEETENHLGNYTSNHLTDETGQLVVQEETSGEYRQICQEDIQLINQVEELLLTTRASDGNGAQWEHPRQQRADALESLLELCARLLKQDKFDELSGILRPFSEDAVSSRETAIWLTKSLINAQKIAKES